MGNTTTGECMPEREAAAYLNKSLPTLRRWRWQRIGPPWIKNGQAVEYLKSDLDAYRMNNRVVPRAAA